MSQRINTLLFEDWDPIGAKALGAPHDEYSTYAKTCEDMLSKGTTHEELYAYLRKVETQDMLTRGNPFVTMNVADKVLQLGAITPGL